MPRSPPALHPEAGGCGPGLLVRAGESRNHKGWWRHGHFAVCTVNVIGSYTAANHFHFQARRQLSKTSPG